MDEACPKIELPRQHSRRRGAVEVEVRCLGSHRTSPPGAFPGELVSPWCLFPPGSPNVRADPWWLARTRCQPGGGGGPLSEPAKTAPVTTRIGLTDGTGRARRRRDDQGAGKRLRGDEAGDFLDGRSVPACVVAHTTTLPAGCQMDSPSTLSPSSSSALRFYPRPAPSVAGPPIYEPGRLLL